MKVLMAVPWEDLGGVVTAAENLAGYLQTQGHEVLLFHPGRNLMLKRTTTERGFSGITLRLCFPFPLTRRVVSVLAFPLLFPLVLIQLMWFLRKHRIQIINVHYPLDNFVYFTLCRRLLSIRLVTSLHGGEAFKNGKPKEGLSRILRWLLDASDLIVLPSSTYQVRLLEAFPEIRDKTIFIHNGIDPVRFGAVENHQEKNGRDRYILCIAHLRGYKGIDVLLQAAKLLFAEDKSLRLVLAGDGPLRRELEEIASTLKISGQTQFLGTQGEAEIAKLLRECELLVLPSREESFGIVLLEAMACKKPVVATAVGGIPEIVEHQKTGILVDPENPEALAAGIRRVLSDGDLRNRIAENGYSRVMERFCSTHNGAAYEQAFNSILGVERRSSRSHSKIPATGR
jgi:L-malate glycosyltransferase